MFDWLSNPDNNPAAPLSQHLTEIERNQASWEQKPLIREIYDRFYERILAAIDPSVPGRVIELGSGIGNLRKHFPGALCTDLFPNPWLDLVCDAYHLPFREGAASNLILFDVFHHLERPFAFLTEAARVLAPGGRVILFEPFISLASLPAYGLFHHEPLAMSHPIDHCPEAPAASRYYAAQGNASRLFFRSLHPVQLPESMSLMETTAFASFAYLLSGGLSKPPLYPVSMLSFLQSLDNGLSRFPRVFGARCLIILTKQPK